VVLKGALNMHYIDHDKEEVAQLRVGDIFFASEGTHHVAYPEGVAKVLVVGRDGSI
jgi:mannose-6-phosphate isomerase-like protein (cupin superfamily)